LLLISIIGILVVAGSVSAAAAALHLLGAGGTSKAASSHSAGTGGTHKAQLRATACPSSTGSTPSICAGTTPGTGTASGHTTLQVTFSGAVTGPLVPSGFSPCGSLKDSQGPYYGLEVEGTIGGKRYIFDLYVRPYSGPGSYTHVTTGGLEGDFVDTTFSSTYVWQVSSGTVTIAADAKSGTLDESLQGIPDFNNIPPAPGPAHVSGTWTCA